MLKNTFTYKCIIYLRVFKFSSLIDNLMKYLIVLSIVLFLQKTINSISYL